MSDETLKARIKGGKEKELSRSANALGRSLNFFGSKEKDFVIQTKGRVKINYGDKFIELFNGSKFTVGGSDVISTTKNKPTSADSDGFYFNEETGTLYLKLGENIYEIFSNAQSENGYISYVEEQTLTGEEQQIAKENIGVVFDTPEEAKISGGNGVVYIKNENKAYILKDGTLYPIINNTEVKSSEDKGGGYSFNNTVTIDVEGDDIVSLFIEGLNKYIRVGEEDNHTDIYQTDKGGMIDADKSLTIRVDDKDVIVVKKGSVNFNSIINALAGIITDEIYSSNFEQNKSGWGLWIDKKSGESYLQVDHILSNFEIEPVYLTYKEAVILIKKGQVVPGTTYIMTDYQNEWEITSDDEIQGENFVYQGDFDPEISEHPEEYEEGDVEPKFGIDRNVRPLKLIGRSKYSFEDSVAYYYKEDNKDIIDLRYDIRESNYSDDWYDENPPDLTNKGRIYYMRDSWNNEAPCDFRHFKNADGKYVFTSKDGEDLSTQNTEESVVCSNNRIYDVTIRLAEEINPIVITGEKINNNTFEGSFENVVIGDETSTIEYNYFNGEIKNCKFIGVFKNNSIGCLMDTCEFKKQVINNEFNKDVKNCTFYEEVTDNVFDTSLEECKFGKISSNQITGSMLKCETYVEGKSFEFKENQFIGDYEECIWKGNISNNDMKVDSVKKCTFEKDMLCNQITSTLWEENTFKDLIAYNIFQANVVKLNCEGSLNNNQFIGRINDVTFTKDTSNPNYGVNNNIINGKFDTCKIFVDFSHNIITGPIEYLTVNKGEIYQGSVCIFNYNTITASSIHQVTVNADFRRNTIKAEVINTVTFDNIFHCNNLNYFNITDTAFNKMIGCVGSGDSLLGSLQAEFTNCEFADISNCIFKSEPIKYAKFRNKFSVINFDSNDSIADLKKLYDEKHQVEVFLHDGNITIFCEACQSPLKGEIKMFSGLASEIPEGWHICDGTEGTPNLIDRFIKASTTAGETGGSEGGEITLSSSNLPAHTHEVEVTGHTHGILHGDTGKHQAQGEGGKSGKYAPKLLGQHFVEGVGGLEDSATVYTTPGEKAMEEASDIITIKPAGGGSSGEGEASPIKIEPPYYTLIFIMKL